MIDVLIVAPNQDEQQAVIDLLPRPRRLEPTDEDNLVYHQCNVKATTGRRQYSVVVCLCEVGRPHSAGNATRAIERWHPRFVLLVGIAGGVRGEAQLGDLLVADQVIDYEQQKIQSSGAQARDRVYPASVRLMNVARNLGQHDWQTLVKHTRPQEGVSAVRVGPVATGDKVVAVGEFLAPIRARWPKLIGVEMEGASVALAVLQSPRRPDFLMIRGVSDMADEQKATDQDAGWRQYARHVAACYALALIASGMIPPSRRRLAIGSGLAVVVVGLAIAGFLYSRQGKLAEEQAVMQHRLAEQEAKTAERTIDVEALRRVAAGFPGFRAHMAYQSGNVEGFGLGRQIADGLKRGGWADVTLNDILAFGPSGAPFAGVSIRVSPLSGDRSPPVADALQRFLLDQGLANVIMERGTEPADTLDIFIGVKPR